MKQRPLGIRKMKVETHYLPRAIWIIDSTDPEHHEQEAKAIDNTLYASLLLLKELWYVESSDPRLRRRSLGGRNLAQFPILCESGSRIRLGKLRP